MVSTRATGSRLGRSQRPSPKTFSNTAQRTAKTVNDSVSATFAGTSVLLDHFERFHWQSRIHCSNDFTKVFAIRFALISRKRRAKENRAPEFSRPWTDASISRIRNLSIPSHHLG